jgi:hypothetical protein
MIRLLSLVLLVAASSAFAQETVDHSGAKSVIPWTMRQDFPGKCNPGQRLTIPPPAGTYGTNDYVCGTSNNWVAMQSAAGATIPSTTHIICGDGAGNGALCSPDLTAAGVVPTTTTVNGHALSSNVTVTASDVSAVPTTTTVNGHALSSNVTVSASDVGAVPTSTTVNGHALSSNVTVTAADVLPTVTISTSGPVTVSSIGFYFNNASGALTYNLPTITSGTVGAQYCIRNAVGKTGAITVQLPASTSADVNGVNGTAAGTLVSSGAAGDAACVVAVSTTQYEAYIASGNWTNN